ncbi:conserved hypothetical protein (putative transposase or invertase) [Oceanobacillus limi]|uniref:Transposase (putative) YhgA-like domain-containing protein n=1 Tax=Oceanobacillus limi TaxID=930131 RepID=A0A1H9Y1Q0_9BACI|nr:conserved hypothetical protein (putative transposase or invertase) [Oceanobacillus limi]
MGFPFFHVLTFHFLKLELRKKNWRAYIESNNPIAAALLSKMGFSKEERVQVKLEFLRMMTKLELNPAKARLIQGFFESYLKLNEKEEEQLMEKIKQLDEADKILELPISYEEKGRREGKKEGKLVGKLEGELIAKRDIARTMLEKGFSEEVVSEVTGLDEEEIQKVKAQR